METPNYMERYWRDQLKIARKAIEVATRELENLGVEVEEE